MELDGWFREISDMWPGQAMTLKVNQVLHHEKSKYQDVLIFESSDHGTVLVLDNVIQCTERDEFSFVLLLFSLPHPFSAPLSNCLLKFPIRTVTKK